MPSLSNSRTASTTQIYGNEWGLNLGVWTLDHRIWRFRVGLHPGTLDHCSPTTRYNCALLVKTFPDCLKIMHWLNYKLGLFLIILFLIRSIESTNVHFFCIFLNKQIDASWKSDNKQYPSAQLKKKIILPSFPTFSETVLTNVRVLWRRDRGDALWDYHVKEDTGECRRLTVHMHTIQGAPSEKYLSTSNAILPFAL